MSGNSQVKRLIKVKFILAFILIFTLACQNKNQNLPSETLLVRIENTPTLPSQSVQKNTDHIPSSQTPTLATSGPQPSQTPSTLEPFYTATPTAEVVTPLPSTTSILEQPQEDIVVSNYPKVPVSIGTNLIASTTHPDAQLPTTLSPNDIVPVIGNNRDGDWLLVLHDDSIGWIPTLYAGSGIGTLLLTNIAEPTLQTCSKYLGATTQPNQELFPGDYKDTTVEGIAYMPKNLLGTAITPTVNISIEGNGIVDSTSIQTTTSDHQDLIVWFKFALSGLDTGSSIRTHLTGINAEIPPPFFSSLYGEDCFEDFQVATSIELSSETGSANVASAPIVIKSGQSQIYGVAGLGQNQILYAADKLGAFSIFARDIDTGAERLVLGNEQFDISAPVWSPDGSKIAFHSERYGNFDIYVMNSDGSSIRFVTRNPEPDTFPSWSPDGHTLAFYSWRDGSYNLYTVDVLTEQQTQLTDSLAAETSPVWSPNGKSIAYESNERGNTDIYILDVSTRVTRRLTNFGADDERPKWSPNGTRLVFVSKQDGDYEVYTINVDGSNPTQLTFNNYTDAFPAWSANGSKIIHEAWHNTGIDLFIMNADGSEQHEITDTSDRERFPNWSPVVNDES
jgi:hypothetical protein